LSNYAGLFFRKVSSGEQDPFYLLRHWCFFVCSGTVTLRAQARFYELRLRKSVPFVFPYLPAEGGDDVSSYFQKSNTENQAQIS